MRKKIIAGNWKMNKTPSEAKALVAAMKDKVKDAAWQFVQWATSPEVEQATAPSTGGPVRAVMEAAGIRDIRAKCLRSNNPNNVVAATFEGLKSMRGPAEVARIRGKNVDEILG